MVRLFYFILKGCEIMIVNCDKHTIVVCVRRDTYKNWSNINPTPRDGELILVTELPWYQSWFGLKPSRLKVGDGRTSFKKLRYV